MTPPSYTNPTLWWTVFGNWLFGSNPNEARIERRVRDLRAAGPDRLARVRAVLVGHGHYDHVMDLPVLARYVPNATVYGSRSVVNTLNAELRHAGRRARCRRRATGKTSSGRPKNPSASCEAFTGGN
jgi:glyoxylase-like metal-dependent hydrolase (beta-lactamase superfamily II)